VNALNNVGLKKIASFLSNFMHLMHNGDTKSPFPRISEQFTLCPKLGLPHLVLTLAGEDEPVPVEFCLPEHVDVVA
jgi:hypothetical protein